MRAFVDPETGERGTAQPLNRMPRPVAVVKRLGLTLDAVARACTALASSGISMAQVAAALGDAARHTRVQEAQHGK